MDEMNVEYEFGHGYVQSRHVSRVISAFDELAKRGSTSSSLMMWSQKQNQWFHFNMGWTAIRVVCTTDDPADDLSYHQKIGSDPSFDIRIVPTMRPDKALAIENPTAFNRWTDRLEAASDMAINDYSAFIKALGKRHDAFHEAGCRSADHGLERPFADDFSTKEAEGQLFA